MSQIPVAERTIGRYLDTLSSSAPAPGGGSVAGLVGALSAALGQMVISLTDRQSDPHPELSALRDRLIEHRRVCLETSAADERAYGGYVAAAKLPRTSDDERAGRQSAMQQALVQAAQVPLGLSHTALDLLTDLETVIRHGSRHVLSDAEIAMILARAAVSTALVNVRINIPHIKDDTLAASLGAEADEVDRNATAAADRCTAFLRERRET
jgi:formiminotetrahydrofolate cyclodeaminase